MTRKDIALTVGGILATMTLAYLFYKMQQRDAAATAAAAQTASDAAAAAGGTNTYGYDPATAQYYQEAAYAQSLPSINIPNLGSSVDTSASTATTGITSTGNAATSSTDSNNLLTQIIAAYAGQTTNPNLLPTLSVTDPTAAALANIPVTAAQATAGTSSSTTLNILNPWGYAVPVNAQVSNPSVTSHPVTAHPIVTTGS